MLPALLKRLSRPPPLLSFPPYEPGLRLFLPSTPPPYARGAEGGAAGGRTTGVEGTVVVVVMVVVLPVGSELRWQKPGKRGEKHFIFLSGNKSHLIISL